MENLDELPGRFGVPRNPYFDRPGGLNYNHIAGNGIGAIQGFIGNFRETGDTRNLDSAESHAD
ncbi:MAG: hypothetical protein ABIG28_00410 [archaeon]